MTGLSIKLRVWVRGQTGGKAWVVLVEKDVGVKSARVGRETLRGILCFYTEG